jgi:hypothetical protein
MPHVPNGDQLISAMRYPLAARKTHDYCIGFEALPSVIVMAFGWSSPKLGSAIWVDEPRTTVG